eukprot:365338-Chlamydomonas_euryale.AAC.7
MMRAHTAVWQPPDGMCAHTAGRRPSEGMRAHTAGRRPSDVMPAHTAGRRPSDGMPAHTAGRRPSEGMRAHTAGWPECGPVVPRAPGPCIQQAFRFDRPTQRIGTAASAPPHHANASAEAHLLPLIGPAHRHSHICATIVSVHRLTCGPHPTSVMSLPSATMRALPSGSSYSP